MVKAVELIIGKEFISEYDDDEVKTKFLINTLKGKEFLRATMRGFVDIDYILDTGLVGWKDFYNEDGTPVEFSQENIDKVPPLILQDIAFAIQSLSTLEEDERKNS